MKWYAETSARRGRQVVGDVTTALWVIAWILIGRWVFGLVRTLAAPADPLRRAGASWRLQLDAIADRVGDIPLVGGELVGPFEGAAGVGDEVVAAGQRLDDGVTTLAWVVSLLVVSLPLVLALAYLLLRWRWARRAAVLVDNRAGPGSQELLALRALVHQPPVRLAKVAADPLGAWRAGDAEVVARLADLELRRFGLRGRPAAGPQPLA